jgi:hypothetical protein
METILFGLNVAPVSSASFLADAGRGGEAKGRMEM